MKTDLVTSIAAAILGVAVSYFICGILLPDIEPATFKKISNSSSSYELLDPDAEVFNYKALNPTVEVYVGDCTEFDSFGNCVEKNPDQPEEEQDETEDTEDAENTENTENTDNTENENSGENTDNTQGE